MFARHSLWAAIRFIDPRIVIAGREFDVAVAVIDRKYMDHHAIIGMDVLRDSGVLIDPSKSGSRDNGNERSSAHL